MEQVGSMVHGVRERWGPFLWVKGGWGEGAWTSHMLLQIDCDMHVWFVHCMHVCVYSIWSWWYNLISVEA